MSSVAGTGTRARKGRYLFSGMFLVGFLLMMGIPASRPGAGVTGSPHDFSYSAEIAPKGTCSACHLAHNAVEASRLWPRSQELYRSTLYFVDGASGRTNYRVGETLRCYDCHDYGATSASGSFTGFRGDSPAPEAESNVLEVGGVNKPRKGAFRDRHRPQDIAFGIRYTGTRSDQNGYDGEWVDDGPGGSAPGYFENNYPNNKPDRDDGGRFGVGSPAGTPQVGGHYFKSAANGSIKAGDKIPCSDCHDAHDYTNQAFIKSVLAGESLGPNLKASSYMANPPVGSYLRDSLGTDSRKPCNACHTLAGSDSPKKYSQVNALYISDADIAQRTSAVNVPEHADSDDTPCTKCHKHNSIGLSCSSCHSYPGMDNTVSDHQMSAGHDKHAGTAGVGGMAGSRGYSCKICHNRYPLDHMDSGYGVGDSWVRGTYFPKTTLVFDNSWNPAHENGTLPSYSGDNTAMGTCSGFKCHGDHSSQGDWGGTRTKPEWDLSPAIVCGSCHATDTGFANSNHPVHLGTPGIFRGPNPGENGFDNVSCASGSGCHTKYDLSASASHVNRQVDFRRTKSSGSTDNVTLENTGVCQPCHSTATVYFDDDRSGTGKGDDLVRTRANWDNTGYRLPCLTCHNGGDPAWEKAAGSGDTAPNIHEYWRVTGHGRTDNVFDNTTTPQGLPLACSNCHDVDSQHIGTNKDAVNPWRLGASTFYTNVSEGNFDQWCGGTTCHAGVPPPKHTWNVALGQSRGSGMSHATSTPVQPYAKAAMFKVPSLSGDKMPLSPAIRTKAAAYDNNSLILCVSCHDPHGTGASLAVPRTFSGSGVNDNFNTRAGSPKMLRYPRIDPTDQHLDLCSNRCHQ